MTASIDALFRDYLTTRRSHDEADRVFNQAERIFRRAVKAGIPDKRAYDIAGVNLADHRVLRAYQIQEGARARLRAALHYLDVSPSKLRIVSRLVYEEFNYEVANDFRPRKEARS
jgi:hypothetical protein